MKKQKAQKSLFSTKEEGDRNYRDMLELCKISQMPYRVIKSTYTMRIESDFMNIHFVKSFMSDKAFIAAQMIKKDIKEKGILPPDIDMDGLKYFQFNQPDNLRNAPENVYNIDLKSAYANVLMNNGVISQKTFDFMKTLMKKDRLACGPQGRMFFVTGRTAKSATIRKRWPKPRTGFSGAFCKREK